MGVSRGVGGRSARPFDASAFVPRDGAMRRGPAPRGSAVCRSIRGAGAASACVPRDGAMRRRAFRANRSTRRGPAPRGSAVCRSLRDAGAASACVPRDRSTRRRAFRATVRCVGVRSARTDQRVGVQHRAEARCAVPSAAPVLRRRSFHATLLPARGTGTATRTRTHRIVARHKRRGGTDAADRPRRRVATRCCAHAARARRNARRRSTGVAKGTAHRASARCWTPTHRTVTRNARRRVERSRGTHADASNGRAERTPTHRTVAMARTPTQYRRRGENGTPRFRAVLCPDASNGRADRAAPRGDRDPVAPVTAARGGRARRRRSRPSSGARGRP